MSKSNKEYGVEVLEAAGATSFLLNTSTVIDAGSLMRTLKEDSIHIENIWLTHSHLDHIVDIAYILDSYYRIRTKSLRIYGLAQTIEAIQKNFLNDVIWPDFSKINLFGQKEKVVIYEVIEVEKKYSISISESLEAFYTDHTVECCGYIYIKNNKALAISSDTYSLSAIQEIIEKNDAINGLIVECSFPNCMKDLAYDSKHLTPELLFKQLNLFNRRDFSLYLNHIKPIYEKETIADIKQNRGNWQLQIIKNREIL